MGVLQTECLMSSTIESPPYLGGDCGVLVIVAPSHRIPLEVNRMQCGVDDYLSINKGRDLHIQKARPLTSLVAVSG
jgi:hypothetical protein